MTEETLLPTGTCQNQECCKELYNGLKYCNLKCSNRARYLAGNGTGRKRRGPTEKKEFRFRVKKSRCGCGQYQTCLVCRNAERRRAWKAGEIPAYRLATLAALVGERG